jgi:hypothetical protein
VAGVRIACRLYLFRYNNPSNPPKHFVNINEGLVLVTLSCPLRWACRCARTCSAPSRATPRAPLTAPTAPTRWRAATSNATSISRAAAQCIASGAYMVS